MIITAKADGTLIKTVPDRVYQGSNNADTIVVVAPIISTAAMNIRFKLPQINEYTQNFLMTPADNSIYAELGVSVWTYSINSALTQYFGTVQAQFAATVNGAVVSSGAFTFEVERGVEVDLPDPEDPNHTYDDIYDYLTDMSTRIFVNGDLEAKAILPYDETFSYRQGATIFNSGDFYTSLVNNNLGNAVTDTTKWQKTDFYSASEVDAIIDTLAGKKYPVGSTTGTGEVFNDYTNNVASGDYSHAEGYQTTASGVYGSHAEGYRCVSNGVASHSEGDACISGMAEGQVGNPVATHAEGSHTKAISQCAHAEGYGTIASGQMSHAECDETTASGSASHAEGEKTIASGFASHAGGNLSVASNENSFAHGYNVNTSKTNQSVFGQYNADDSDALFIIGNGSADNARSNAFVVKENGAIYGGNNKELSTKEYVDTVALTKQNVIDASHKLSADLVDDTSTTNKFVTASEKSQITTNANDISAIEDLIPEQATALNQLADKNFVNSSISTNTANFIGTFASITALNNYAGTVTNNDYAFVINQELDFATTTAMNAYDKTLLTNYDYAWVENGAKFDLYRFDIVEQTWGVRATNISKGDVSLIVAYNRYKYNGTTSDWNWEYTLNTSGFTASQWAAINSGATDTLIGKITTNETNITSLQTGKVDKTTTATYGYSPDSFNTYLTTLTGQISNANGVISITSDAPLEASGFTDIETEIKVNAGNIDLNASGPTGRGKIRANGNLIETQNNKVTSIDSNSTDAQYPSAKCVYDLIGDVETLLASI